jgi:hypothetical protein
MPRATQAPLTAGLAFLCKAAMDFIEVKSQLLHNDAQIVFPWIGVINAHYKT